MANHSLNQQQQPTLAISVVSHGLQRAAVSEAPVREVPPIVHEVLRSTGKPLDMQTRAFMEPRFGRDFSGVPVNGMGSSTMQSQLAVGKPDDNFEVEADVIAEHITRMTAPKAGRRYDFSGVRVHTDTQAAESARSVNALAYTVGSDVVFGAGQYVPQTSVGRRLMAHELAHVVQQTDVNSITRMPVLQRHASFEHRLLGDMPTVNLEAVVGRISPGQRQHVLAEERRRLQLWQRHPEQVTEERVRSTWPDVRVLRLNNGLILTYGELNSLPDYMPNPQSIDTVAPHILLPILQTIRQQSFNRLTDYLGVTRTQTRHVRGETVETQVPDYQSFEGAVGPVGGRGTIASIHEVAALDRVTRGQGANQYSALLSRNACHFAPYSWRRWQEFHAQARDLAVRGHASGSADLLRQAWLYNGYADHFLQDSFAAGHLINKTLIMQWFVEWVEHYNARTRWYERDIHIANWDQIRTMTTREQPGLAAQHLYGTRPRRAVESADPQTAEEQGALQTRMSVSGVRSTRALSQEEAYQNYLAFLNSAPVQQASGAIHDHFNERSLWVSSAAYPRAYRIWGDETMTTSGEGVRIVSETAQMSQQAIQDLTSTGQTTIPAQQIRDRFPSIVHLDDGQVLPLDRWNENLRDLCFRTIFPQVHYRLLSEHHMGHVSIDQGRQTRTSTSASQPMDAGVPTPRDGGVGLPGGVPDAGVPNP